MPHCSTCCILLCHSGSPASSAPAVLMRPACAVPLAVDSCSCLADACHAAQGPTHGIALRLASARVALKAGCEGWAAQARGIAMGLCSAVTTRQSETGSPREPEKAGRYVGTTRHICAAPASRHRRPECRHPPCSSAPRRAQPAWRPIRRSARRVPCSSAASPLVSPPATAAAAAEALRAITSSSAWLGRGAGERGAGHVNPLMPCGEGTWQCRRTARRKPHTPAGWAACSARRQPLLSSRPSRQACKVRTGRVQYCTVRTWVKAASAATLALCRSLLSSSAGAAAADELT